MRFTQKQMKQERRRAAKNALARNRFGYSIKRVVILAASIWLAYGAGYYTTTIIALWQKYR